VGETARLEGLKTGLSIKLVTRQGKREEKAFALELGGKVENQSFKREVPLGKRKRRERSPFQRKTLNKLWDSAEFWMAWGKFGPCG